MNRSLTLDYMKSDTYQQLKAAFAARSLLADKSWQLSPEPLALPPTLVGQLKPIGQACLQLYQALEVLYLKSMQGQSLLRNSVLKAPWVAAYYNRGKPISLVEHSCHPACRGLLPCAIRPDLLLTDTGFSLTELDAVPGGIGLTAFLNQTYGALDWNIAQAPAGLLTAFYQALKSCVPEHPTPRIAIVISDECATYRPEMEWACEYLNQNNEARMVCCHPSLLEIRPDGAYAPFQKGLQRVDLIYRFFELFDLPQIPVGAKLMQLVEAGKLSVTPPFRPFQEEKLTLGLLHHPELQAFWVEQLPAPALKLLQRLVPQTWIVQNVPLPPGAFWEGPKVNGKSFSDWRALGSASLKERKWVLKISGFHETAWGARGVVVAADKTKAEWQSAVETALSHCHSAVYVLQDYHKPKRLSHPVYSAQGLATPAEHRARICPYYFVSGNSAVFGGALATLCPIDKKIIHGMTAACLVPVQGVN